MRDTGSEAGPSGAEPSRVQQSRSVLRSIPGLARIGVFVAWRTTEWSVETAARASARVFRAARYGESPAQLFQETGVEVREYLRTLLGVLDSVDDGRAARGPIVEDPGEPEAHAASGNGRIPGRGLRERGIELLRRSADVEFDEDSHPAYENILDDLAPDEGRILRLLAEGGPQPAIDIRSGLPLASQLVEPGISMIASEAGCRHQQRTHAYLNNLHRLGLVWFSRESLDDMQRYQVLEAQPESIEAMERAGRTARTVRRTIGLTPFGADFCEVTMPLDTNEIESLPGGPLRSDPGE